MFFFLFFLQETKCPVGIVLALLAARGNLIRVKYPSRQWHIYQLQGVTGVRSAHGRQMSSVYLHVLVRTPVSFSRITRAPLAGIIGL